ncbi:hypothetical protein SO802_031716 [Lithocarpus litseifolius]|uniref:DUF4283 domain-containing protein n=1 Tax=Lithocarpus litseifolius TaxID=425828 RepID=A0AAW2BL94_9ROSI
MAKVRLSKETKSQIREPWSKALIVKVFGRTVGFNYPTFKINALWRPSNRMDCVNLGKDFFLIKFRSTEDYNKVLRGGPWFVGEHFLAIRPWEPYFKASEAKLSSVAVWVRLLELPIEFYDRVVLKDISEAIRPMLYIDAYTATESRGSYARGREVEQAMKAISDSVLRRIGMAHSGKEVGGLQRDSIGPLGESSNLKANSNFGTSPKVRSADMLQGGHSWHSQVHDGLETRVGNRQGPLTEDGLKHGGGIHVES